MSLYGNRMSMMRGMSMSRGGDDNLGRNLLILLGVLLVVNLVVSSITLYKQQNKSKEELSVAFNKPTTTSSSIGGSKIII